MAFIILLITILFVSFFQITVPFIVKRTVVFGVTIPYNQTKHPKVMQYKKVYAIVTTIVAIIVTVSFWFWSQTANVKEVTLVLAGTIIPFIILIIGLSLYFYFHYKMTKLKRSQQWYGTINQVHYADLKVRSRDEMLASFVHLIPIIMTVALMALTILSFDRLPSQIPTHWGPDGQPDAFTEKSWMSVINLPILLLVMQLMFFGINVFTKRSGIKINAGNITSSTLRQLRLRKYTSWFLFVTNILITILFSLIQLQLLYENLLSESLIMLFPLVFLVLILAGAVGLAVKVGSVDSDLEGKALVHQDATVEGIDEDQYWKGGLIYFNSNDPSIFVEKRFGIGWTLNFANPIGYFVLIGPVVLILILSFMAS
ncbi:DUF1648 domain-containing protein [Radiobacillus sp. PE A8.2]|uniref:DUF1648 domain-containing protein n=1 Tax=Radiobacillus sp. PE A8.2 TaxID=3380349 RepID=UPI0038901887